MATTQNNYTGNGSNKLFSITFPYLDTADIDVYLNSTLQTVTTQYSFANATTIEFVAAPANGAAVRIDRSTDDSALAATFFPGSSIKAADLNADFDQTLYVVQEINNKAVKLDDPLYANKTYIDNADALKVAKAGDTMSGVLAMGTNKITGLGNPTNAQDAATKTYVDAADALKVAKAGDTMSGNLAMGGNKVTGLGTPSANADAATKVYVDTVTLAGNVPDGDRGDITVSGTGTVWSIDNGAVTETKLGTGSVTSAKIADGTIVNDDVNASAGIVATKLAFTQSGTGATARTVDSKLKDVVSVKDFGAVGDGTTNDTAAFVAALAASDSVFVPIGSYVISSTVTIAARKSLIGAGNKVIILSSVAAGSAAFRLGTAGTTELQYYSALGSLTIQPTVAGNVGVLLYQTCGASVQDIWINSENNLNTTGFKIDGGNMSSFFNILKNCYALHCSVGYDILSTGSSYATQQVFIDCSSFGDYPTVATSIGMRFTGPNGLDSSVYAGNFESCGTGIKVINGTGLNFNGVRFEANGTDVDLNATTANCTFISCKNISTASGIPGSGDGYGGNVFIGNSGAAGLTNHLETTRLYAASASAIPLKIEAYASQTANLTSWTNNVGLEIAQIRPTGGFWTSEKIAIGGTAYPADFTWDANASLQIKGGGGYNSISFGYPSTADYMAITYNGTSLVAKNQAGTGVYLVNGGTSWVSLSDRNQKTFISSIDNGLSKVMTLKAIIYRYLNDGITVRRPGLFAQDVQAVLPEAVIENEDGTLGLSYTEIIPLLVAAIQDLKQELTLLQNKP